MLKQIIKILKNLSETNKKNEDLKNTNMFIEIKELWKLKFN